MARELRYTTYNSSEESEPIDVYLGPEGDDTKEEKFVFRPMIAGTDIMDLLGSLTSENSSEVAKATMKLLDLAVTPDDHGRFFEYISDPDNMVGPFVLEDIAVGLAEQYMRVPTERGSNSSNGSAPSGSGREASPSKDKAKTSRR